MRNIRLIVEYDGTDFFGWQRQPDVPTIQGEIESALEKIFGEKLTLYGSGRTDAGVHALNQAANFKTAGAIPCENLLRALNDLLPLSVRIKKAENVAESFHARYGARAKTYRYRILCAPVASPFVARFVYHYPHPLDQKQMAAAARLLVGEHDFTSFAASPSHGVRDSGFGLGQESNSTFLRNSNLETRNPEDSNVRTIFTSRLTWRPRTSILAYEVRGSGFLHHMVRNIVGTLIEVGRGKLAPPDVRAILKARDRARAGPTAPASGLCLVKVEYGPK
jgi:tRNA pseudouridine38-40 synthase